MNLKKKHKHHHAGKSSRSIISVSKVFDLLDLPQGIVFLDAECGDGYFSIEAFLILKKIVFSFKESFLLRKNLVHAKVLRYQLLL